MVAAESTWKNGSGIENNSGKKQNSRKNMTVRIDVEKRLEEFLLEVEFASDSRRIGILGASGCGKSMTLRCIAGIETPDKGRIEIGGQTLFDSDKKINVKPQKRNAGYLFQNYALFPAMTVEQNIAAGLRGEKEKRHRRVQEMVKRFGLSGLEKRLPGELSGGQQQRTALARIMAYEPELILLDEPYAALDVFLRDRLLQELLDMLKEYEGTVIMVSHDRDEIYRFSEDLLVMEEGRTCVFGKSRDVFQNPKKRTAARLTGCKNISRIRILGENHLEALDFGVILHTDRRISEHTTHIGYRAHEFLPVWGKREENCIRLQVESIAELPFERQYYIRPEKEDGTIHGSVCWFTDRAGCREIEKKGLPDYLKFSEERIVFLED